MPRRSDWPWLLAMAFVFVLAAFLRFDRLGEPSLWYDEVLHLEKTREALEEPWSAWLTGLGIDRENGPLFYAGQLLALRGSTSEAAVRRVPAVLGSATVLIMIALGLAACGRRSTALVAGIMLATSPLHVYFSREGRPYAAVMLMASLLLLLLLLRPRAWTVPAAYAATVITAYQGAVAAPVLIAFAILTLADWMGWRRSRPGQAGSGHFVAAAVVGIGVILMIFPTAERLVTSRMAPDFIVTSPLSTLAFNRLLASLTVTGVDWETSRPTSLVLLALAGFGIFSLVRRDRRRALMVTGMFILPIATWITLLVLLDRWYIVRYTSAGLPAFLLLAAIGLVSLTESCWRWTTSGGSRNRFSWVPTATAMSVTALLVLTNWSAVRSESWQKPDWRGLARMIGLLAAEDEPIVAHSRWAAYCIRHYLAETGHAFEVYDTRDDVRTAREIVEAHRGAWVLSAGYRKAVEFRSWMRTLDPVVKGHLANLALYYGPDFRAFVEPPARAMALEALLEVRPQTGNRLEFDDSELLLGVGWSYPETSGDGTGFRWAIGETADLALLDEARGNSTLRLRLLPFPRPDQVPQILDIRFNDRPLRRLQLKPGWEVYELSIPEDFKRPGMNLVTMDFAWRVSPSELDPDSGDSRSLAAAFDSVSLVADPLNRGSPDVP